MLRPLHTLVCVLILIASWLPIVAAEVWPPAGRFALHNGGKCLDVNGPQIQIDGARVHLWDCLDRPSQQWRYEAGRIINEATGRCLDVHGPDVGFDGARVQVLKCHDGANQLWRADRGLLLVAADRRCLDVYGPESDRNGAQVRTWNCSGNPRQRWVIEASAQPHVVATRDIEAGPLWNNADADNKCPSVCAPSKWTGAWRTTVQGQMSVCACEIDDVSRPPERSPQLHDDDQAPAGPGARAMADGAFDHLLAALQAESFPDSKFRVLDDATRDNFFVIAQLRRVMDSLTFASDKLRAVESMAPRILDRQNAFTLYGAFNFDSEKDQVRAIFDALR